MSIQTSSMHGAVRVGLLLVFASVNPPAVAQQASIGGTVLNEATEKPLANAEVWIESAKRSARSDVSGNFAITGLNAGRYVVVVRLLGFDAFKTDITLTANQKFEADYLLKSSVTTLKGVDVTAKSAPAPWAIKLAEFEERRTMDIGKFLTADVFEKANGRPLSAILLDNLAGIRAMQSNGRYWLASAHGGKPFGCKQLDLNCPALEKIPPACYVQVVVNGLVVYNGSAGQQMFDVDAINSKDVIGFEFYSTATTPAQYNGTRGKDMGSCGTVIIWTKGG